MIKMTTADRILINWLDKPPEQAILLRTLPANLLVNDLLKRFLSLVERVKVQIQITPTIKI